MPKSEFDKWGETHPVLYTGALWGGFTLIMGLCVGTLIGFLAIARFFFSF